MTDTGPLAFPQTPAVGPAGDVYWPDGPGMTLRDYFAGQALVTFATHHVWPSDDDFEELAARAYGIADAMIEQRKK